jgi:hypothetical protein
VTAGHGVELSGLPQRSTGTGLNIYRTKANGGPGGTFYLVVSVPGTQNTKSTYIDGLGDDKLTNGIDGGKPRGAQLTADGALMGVAPDVSVGPTTGTDNGTAPINGANPQLSAGNYYYLFTFVDSTGVESNPSDEIGPVPVTANHGVNLDKLPTRAAGTRLNIYRTKANGSTFYLVGSILGTDNTTSYLDGKGDDALMVQRGGQAAPDVAAFGTTRGDADNTSVKMYQYTYEYIIAFVTNTGLSFASKAVPLTVKPGNHAIELLNIPVGPAGTTARRIFRKHAGDSGPYKSIGDLSGNSSTTVFDITSDDQLGDILRDADAPNVGGVTTSTSTVAANNPTPGNGAAISPGTYR